MKYLPKDAQKLSDEVLAKLLFPKEALSKIKEELANPPKKKRSK